MAVEKPKSEAEKKDTRSHAEKLFELKEKIKVPEPLQDAEFEKLSEGSKFKLDQIRTSAFLDIIPGLALAGARKYEMSKIDNLPYLLKSFSDYKPSVAAKSVLLDLRLIAKEPDKTPMHRYLMKNWKFMVAEAHQSAEIAFGKEFEADSIPNSTMRFLKRSNEKHPVATKLAIIGGMVGAYTLMKTLFGREKEQAPATGKAGYYFGKAIPWAVGGGALFLIGKHFKDEVTDLLDIKTDLVGRMSALKEAQEDLKNGKGLSAFIKMAEAAGIKAEELKPDVNHHEATKTINSIINNQEDEGAFKHITPESLSIYRKIKLKDIDSIMTRINSKGAIQSIMKSGDAGYMLSFFEATKNNPKAAEDIQTFRKMATAMQMREDIKLKINSEMTVNEVIAVMQDATNKVKINESFEKSKLEEDEGKSWRDVATETGTKAVEIGVESLDYNKQLLSEASKDMLEDYKWLTKIAGGKAVYEVIEYWDLKWNDPKAFAAKHPEAEPGFEEGDAWEFTKEFIDQCNQQSIPLAISAGTILMFDGTKWLTTAAIRPIGGFFYELANSGSFSKAVGVYGVTASPFVVFGATKGALMGPSGLANKLKAGAWGGLKGMAAPIKVVEVAYDATYYGMRAKQYTGSKKRLVITKAKELTAFREKTKIKRYPERILALEEKRNLLMRKISEKIGPVAKGGWEKELVAVEKEIGFLKKELRTLETSPKAEIAKRVKVQLEGLYGKKMPKSAIDRISAKVVEELLNPDIANPYSQHFLFDRYSSKLVRNLNKLGFNKALMEAMMQDEALMKALSDPRLARNKSFFEALKAGIEKGGLVRNGKLDSDLVRKLAIQTAEEPNFAQRWLNSLKSRMGDKFDKFKSKTANAREWAKATEGYKKAADLADKARQMPGKAAKGAVQRIGLTEARQKYETLRRKPNLTKHESNQLRRLERFIEKNDKALAEIQKNPQMRKIWNKYIEMLATEGELPPGKMVSAVRFLRYKNLLFNAARLGGAAGIIFSIHHFENAENKADAIAELGIGWAAGIGTVKGATMAFRATPGPVYAKAIGAGLAAAAGLVGTYGAINVYEWGAKTIGDRYFINRGRGKGWEAAGSILEVLGGAGIGSFAEMGEYWNILNNIDLEDLIDKQGEVVVPKPFFYQEYLSASSVDLTAGKRRHYKSLASWNREVKEMLQRNKEEIKDLEKDRDEYAPDSDKWDEIQSQIEDLTERMELVESSYITQKDGKPNLQWQLMQQGLLQKREDLLDEQRENLVDHLPKHKQKEAQAFIDRIAKRIQNNANEIVTDEEQDLWKMLRDVKPLEISRTDEEGKKETEEFGFPEWFLQFKEQQQRQFLFETILKHGKIPHKKNNRNTKRHFKKRHKRHWPPI